jgi:tetratricopeptide (TPR) repeat protein
MAAGVEATEGETETARAHAERAERLLGSTPEKADLGMLRIVQARIEQDPARAVAREREAVDLLGRYHGGEQGSAIQALAAALARQGDLSGADEAYRRAIDLLAVHGRRAEAATACAEWAEMLRAAGRSEEAEAALERARTLDAAHVN